MSIKLEQVRTMLRDSGRPYSASARRAVVAYAGTRCRAGVGVTRVGRELGLSPATVLAWLNASPLVPVEIVAAPEMTEAPGSALVLVDTHRGLRVEGLSLDAVIHILERLR